MRKFQIPITKFQRNANFQTYGDNGNGIGAWGLKLLWNLVVEIWTFFPRGLAIFLGCFSLLNLLGDLRSPGFDANLWWIDLRVLPASTARIVLLCSSVSLLTVGIRPPRSIWARALTGYFVGLLFVVGCWNSLEFFLLLVRRMVHPMVPLPLSLFIAVGLAMVLRSMIIGSTTFRRSQSARCQNFSAIAVCLVILIIFPLLQMFFFGKTDYRRPADIAVVLGARVYADGRLSDALADRVRTACQLYRDGYAKKLLFSGGPGDGVIHETEAMKSMAIRLGVKPGDILLDEAGLNTQATVKNSEKTFAELHASRILVVSHFYHLPRIKLAYQRRGWDVYTVPAKESYVLRQLPYNMAREVAALWVYYLRPLGSAQG